MTREDYGVVGQRKQLGANFVHKQVVVTAREVGTSYVATKEGVACEYHLGIVGDVADASRTMTGHMATFDRFGSYGQFVAAVDIIVFKSA